ncbi:hypothetical protein Rrhod_0419 [Rhodococcus rhodnii LMG 5362]|uniref:Uncharacterized protein n=1 Tax=Rhodococcus rhodnii LMG 5362 TaxID=1273125 RepID=R7WSD6_9NOCA|nr:hypothetical protein Rrhod_0419 [Rhodococcus rhodnii LMG 5362]
MTQTLPQRVLSTADRHRPPKLGTANLGVAGIARRPHALCDSTPGFGTRYPDAVSWQRMRDTGR